MFEEPPENLPVQDIFESVEPAAGAGASPALPRGPRPAAIRHVGAAPRAVLESPGGGAKKILLFVGISGGVLALLVVGGTVLLNIAKNKQTPPAANTPKTAAEAGAPAANVNVSAANIPTEAAVNLPVNAPAPITEPPANVPAPTPVVSPSLRDSDNDGLNDAQEISFGTDPNKADTDADGLNDFDEVRTWQSDPLNPDTDGDGYPDGSEVKNGYSPTGPGKIMLTP